MTKANTQVIAKVAAIVAGAGLVLSSFAYALPAGAQTTTTTTTTTSSMMFTRDLTLGSTGADVTALQTWLIGKGFSIPAGATGYFGAQTQAAVAAYQAANGITPAAGYFGPITRAKVNAGGSVVIPGDDDDDDDSDDDDDADTGDLEGGEADLSEYDLSDEEATVAEGAEEAEIATAEFDVEDGDVMVERIELSMQASGPDAGDETDPWRYFDTVYVMADGDVVAEVDASDRDEWDEGDTDDDSTDDYTLNITDIDFQVDEDDTAELTFAVDVSDGIDDSDLNQEFLVWVPEDGIRAIDSEDIQQYIGDETDQVEFGFEAEESGDLDIQSSSEDPDTMTLVSDEDEESEEYSVFVFELENNDDVDVLLNDLTIDVAVSSTTVALDDIIEDATLIVDGEEVDGDISTAVGADTIDFEDIDVIIGGDDTIEVELVITLAEDADGTTLDFTVSAGNVEAESDETGEDSDVSGSASSETHTVSIVDFTVDQTEADSDINDDGDRATYTIEFEVTAGEEDVYIDNNAAEDAADDADDGVVYNLTGDATVQSSSADLSSTADETNDQFIVRAGETETFTLTVTVSDVAVADEGYVGVELTEVRYSEDEDDTSPSVYTVDEEEAGPEFVESSDGD